MLRCGEGQLGHSAGTKSLSSFSSFRVLEASAQYATVDPVLAGRNTDSAEPGQRGSCVDAVSSGVSS